MIFITKPLVFTILLMGIFGITEVVSTKRGRRIRPSVQAYQNQNLPIQQSPPPVPQNNYYKPSSGYSTTTAQKPVRPAAPRPGIVVFGVGPHSLQIPNQYSNFPAPSYQNGKPISQIPYTSQNTAATKPALKPNPAAKPVAYIEPVKSSNPVQHVQPAKSPQYGNKIPTSNYANQQRPSSPEVPKAPAAVVKVPEKVPVYISPVKSTVYASAYVSDPSNSPASNAYTKKETSDYQTTTPSYTSKSSVSSSYKDTKAYQTTETYSKITTKSEIKENQPSYYSTTSSTVKVSENISKKEKSYAKKEESDAKKEESHKKKEESKVDEKSKTPAEPQSYKKVESLATVSEGKKKEESNTKKEESKVDESKSKTPVYPEPQSYKKVESLATVSEGKKKEESNTKKEESKVDESKSKTPVYPEPQSYKKVESLATISEGKKKEESNTKKEESDVNVNKSKSPVYSAPQPYKKLESSSATEEKKKEDSPSYSYSAPQSKPESDKSSKKNSDDVSKVEKSKPKTPIYPIPQSYKKAESQPDNEEKEKLDGPAYVSHSVQENKPVKESYGKNPYQESFVDESEPSKGPVYSASLSSNKKVESLPSSEQKKTYDSPSLPYYAPEKKPLSEPSNKKNQNKESDADETKVKTSGYSAPQYYKEVEALPHTADNQKQNVPNYIPTSKPYQQPKSAPVSVSTKASYSAKEEVKSYSPAPISVPTKASYPAKEEVKSYSQSKPTESPVYSTKPTKSSEYSTESTTTEQKYKIPSQDRTKAYYGTTSKYQESTTYSTLATSTEKQKVYTSSTYEKIPVATTQGYIGYKYPTTTKAYNTKATSDELVSIETPYVSYSSTASPGVKSNDRVYVVSSQEEQANLYQKPEPSSNYQSYSNTGRDQSGDDRSSYLVKPVVNEYKSTEKSSKDYTPIDTENKTNYKARPIASPADYLSTFNSKPSNEKIDSSKIFAAVAENFKTGVHTADGSSENEGDYSAIPGEPGTDYPIFSELPNDQFNCSEQRLPGYYADVSARCQVFHICLGDRQWSFLCPNGTIFSQEHFVCVWWYEFDCSKATSLYNLNEKLFVISSTEQSTEGENEENKQYGESSAISEISKKSDQDYRSSKTNKEESIIGSY